MSLYKTQNWCIEQHRDTNHMYDQYLPYEFHLRMVVEAYKDFKHLLPENLLTREDSCYHNSFETVDETHDAIEKACWGHDLIEDCRVSYNDVNRQLGYNAANIVYAVTNEKGKTRSERANATYYEGIRNTPGAVFVKLCDRIANVQYSKMTKSRMFEKYRDENPNFEKMLGRHTDYKHLEPMFQYIENLFTS
jgi:(p)ppGpp synthase/HD superfamily hydrolase